jgi:hypothetical protein
MLNSAEVRIKADLSDAYEKLDEFASALTGSVGTGAAAAAPARGNRGGGAGAGGTNVPGIGIEVSARVGGTLYFQDEEVAMLWDNDTYTIPIEKPGTYTVKMVLGDGSSRIRTVSITARGITKLDFSRLIIGDPGPGGGIVFFAQGERYLEVSGILGNHTWSDAISVARNHRGGGYSDWRLPTKDELNLIYQNLRAKNIGNLGDSWYWSSSEHLDRFVWEQRFSDGYQVGTDARDPTVWVRAVRAF